MTGEPMQPDTEWILSTLAELYPNPRTALHFETPFQLLIATMLSAQCTDKRVNIITQRLFPRLGGPEDFLKLPQEALEDLIRDCGLYREKARNIRETCRLLLERHGGEVPARFEDLVRLPGVGRKTANVVLANAFGIPALAVDTHVFRVANRLGLARGRTPEEVERQLTARIPRDRWIPAHHWLIYHGRNVCHARSPRCEACPLRPECAHARAQAAGTGPAAWAGERVAGGSGAGARERT
ncbi:endonuclease III [Caldinitratiruptor microaerophilus]|uniref:Endonuclease III n=2 Tax=Caldinitratiruptor microaerophilus TaxID=671077 RepID=A0AA35CMQ8_9FIRM|nr:endonuclease III [Caldinitratiruptor microaerophilus]